MSTGSIDFENLEIVDLRIERNEELLDLFYRELYCPSFPRRIERESPQVWAKHLWPTDGKLAPHGLEKPPIYELHMLVAGWELSNPVRRRLCAGHLFEFYSQSACGLLTYLAVAAEHRNRGLGRLLQQRAMAILSSRADAHGIPLRAVFGEAADPRLVAKDEDVIDPWTRLEILERLRGRVVDIPYVQPELIPGQGRGRELLLLVFSQPGSRRSYQSAVPALIVREFLHEFYKALGVDQPEHDSDFVNMLAAIEGEEIPLVTLRSERPALSLERFGIALHFVGCSGRIPGELNPSLEFASFERDVVAYVYRDAPPFASEAIGLPEVTRAEITFPRELEFTSEGERTRLWCAGQDEDGLRRREFRLLRSRTVFGSGVAVCHLVLGPTEDLERSNLNEYDLVKLVKLYEGGESVDAKHSLRFSIDGAAPEAFDAWVGRVFQDLDVAPATLRAGSIQIVAPDDEEDWSDVYGCAELLADKREVALARLEELFPKTTGGKLKAIAGILTGILDLEEIDYWELADTLEPVIAAGEDVWCLHKGTLLYLTGGDRTFDISRLRVGISPYLIAPHSVLLHNQEVLNRAEECLDAARSGDPGKLEELRGRAECWLSEHLLPNLFHYRTERVLYDAGCGERALDARSGQMRRRLDELTRTIEARARRNERLTDMSLEAFIAFISALAIRDPIFSALEGRPEWQWSAYLSAVALIVVVLCYLVVRARRF